MEFGQQQLVGALEERFWGEVFRNSDLYGWPPLWYADGNNLIIRSHTKFPTIHQTHTTLFDRIYLPGRGVFVFPWMNVRNESVRFDFPYIYFQSFNSFPSTVRERACLLVVRHRGKSRSNGSIRYADLHGAWCEILPFAYSEKLSFSLGDAYGGFFCSPDY